MGAARERTPLDDVGDFLAQAEARRERHGPVRGRVVVTAEAARSRRPSR